MRIFVGIFALSMGAAFGLEGAARAKALVRAYDQKFDVWVEAVKDAKSTETRVAAWETKPDSKAYGASWDEAGEVFKGAVDKATWSAQV